MVKIRILETNAFECSLCTKMENYRIKMCNCKCSKMRKETSKNSWGFFSQFSNFPLLALTNTSSNNSWFFLLLTGQGHKDPKYIPLHSNPHSSSPNHKGMCSVMTSQYLFLFFSYGENGVTNHDNAKHRNYSVVVINALVENTFHLPLD